MYAAVPSVISKIQQPQKNPLSRHPATVTRLPVMIVDEKPEDGEREREMTKKKEKKEKEEKEEKEEEEERKIVKKELSRLTVMSVDKMPASADG